MLDKFGEILNKPTIVLDIFYLVPDKFGILDISQEMLDNFREMLDLYDMYEMLLDKSQMLLASTFKMNINKKRIAQLVRSLTGE